MRMILNCGRQIKQMLVPSAQFITACSSVIFKNQKDTILTFFFLLDLLLYVFNNLMLHLLPQKSRICAIQKT